MSVTLKGPGTCHKLAIRRHMQGQTIVALASGNHNQREQQKALQEMEGQAEDEDGEALKSQVWQ
eukprot:5395387-Ditylum_brightwellii.AAC.1